MKLTVFAMVIKWLLNTGPEDDFGDFQVTSLWPVESSGVCNLKRTWLLENCSHEEISQKYYR